MRPICGLVVLGLFACGSAGPGPPGAGGGATTDTGSGSSGASGSGGGADTAALTDAGVTDGSSGGSSGGSSSGSDTVRSDTGGSDTGGSGAVDSVVDSVLVDRAGVDAVNVDCGPPDAGAGCPAKAPIGAGSSCKANVACSYGKECCCGKCSPSMVCKCGGGQWACAYTDFCLGARKLCPDAGDAKVTDAGGWLDGSATDTSGGVDTAGTDTLAKDCPGGPFCACKANADCDSGICIPGKGGAAAKICAQPCVSSCPAGYVCKALTPSGGDTFFVCQPS